MRRQRQAKIIATLGPASETEDMIEKLFLAGVDVFRINMSHSDHPNLKARHDIIRRVEKKHSRPIAVLVDLQGPKLRIDTFATEEVTINAGDTFVLDMDETPGDETRVHLPHPEIFQAVKPGENLLLNDGRIRLEVTSANDRKIETLVIFGGVLSARKGVNLPDTIIPLTPLTEKDLADLDYALTLDIDWVALSFVQQPSDVAEARAIIGDKAGIMVKVEKPSALNYLDDIIEQTDAVMVARGDLGVELPLESVPGWQKRMVRACRRAGKPVVVATQMLESMIQEPVPTRAEVSDVATALFEGADAIMLSAESAAGQWPEEAVATMDKIAQSIERDPLYANIIKNARTEPQPTSADAISNAARTVAETLN
ncbi:MAG: pyruvate kinase, partial [Pseudomonadota bacterium]